jgi:hypothetical protein
VSNTSQDKAWTEWLDDDLSEEIRILKSAVDNLSSPKTADDLVDFICNNFDPADVFTQTQLREWAEQNGWVKE